MHQKAEKSRLFIHLDDTGKVKKRFLAFRLNLELYAQFKATAEKADLFGS